MNASCSEDKHLNTPAHTQQQQQVQVLVLVLGRRMMFEMLRCRQPAGADEDEGAAVTFG